jgi:hypothetical protein
MKFSNKPEFFLTKAQADQKKIEQGTMLAINKNKDFRLHLFSL